jgi:hypothetical protein
MDCAICFNHITTSCVGSCNHHFCAECLIQWCKTNNVCPKCKCVIREIKPDPEFDNLTCILLSTLSGTSDDLGNKFIFNLLHAKNCREIIIDFPPNSKAGITLTNNSGPGVKITKLSGDGRARASGLVSGNIIISINNVPCINHKQVIGIFDECMFSNKIAKCVIISSRGTRSRSSPRLGNKNGGNWTELS